MFTALLCFVHWEVVQANTRTPARLAAQPFVAGIGRVRGRGAVLDRGDDPALSPAARGLTAHDVDHRATLQKVSRRLIPFLFLLYVAAYLDRINVGFAQLQMKSALGFSDSVYGLGAGIFFIGYFLFEVPSNLILARVGARVWIARIMITWGVISSAMAFVHTPASFYVLRFLLGVAEAGFFPGIIYYLGLWFPAEERAAAVSKFMTATAIAGVVGAPMSAALFTLDGVAGLAGWQWIFVAEGIPSVVLGVVVLFFLTERPDVAGWLSPEQRRFLSARVKVGDDAIARRGIGLRAALLHPIVWRLALLYFTLILGFYSISFWSPQIIQSLSGLGNVQVALISAIPYIVAAIAMVIVGAHSDRTRERCAHVAAAAFVGALGMAASAYVQSPYPRRARAQRRGGRHLERGAGVLVAAHGISDRHGGGRRDRVDQFVRQSRGLRRSVRHRARSRRDGQLLGEPARSSGVAAVQRRDRAEFAWRAQSFS